jgi:hypothetical protein
MTLTDPQWRVLTYLARFTKWTTVPELGQVEGLREDESACVSALVDLDLAEMAHGLRVRLTPAGQVVAEEPRQ